MTAIASDRADYWGFQPANYLNGYCQQNGLTASSYYVDCKQDESTGLQWYYIHPNADGGASAPDASAANPAPLDPAPTDPEVVIETAIAS